MNASSDLINRIQTNLIDPNYYNDVDYNINGRSRWKMISDISGTVSQICTGVATILAFAAGYFNSNVLSFLAGCFGTVALVLIRFSSYAMQESSDRTIQTNILLQDLGISKIVDISGSNSQNSTRVTPERVLEIQQTE
jgi:hypothetical protein